MNWRSYLKDALKSIYTKGKSNHQEGSDTWKSYYADKKKKLKDLEGFLNRKEYKLGKWTAEFQDKPDGGKRPIIKPRFNDKLVYKAISHYLTDVFSAKFKKVDSVSFAYQKGKSVRDALIQLKKIHRPDHILLKIDIFHFFDEINQEKVMQIVEKSLVDDYVKQLIKKGINPDVDYSALSKQDKEQFPQGGIPQGNPVSAVLSNLYLWDFDQFVLSNRWRMVRYADDMVFSVSKLEEAKSVLNQVSQYLNENLGLSIHTIEEKNGKTAIYKSPKKQKMKYLGVYFDGEKIIPTKESQQNLLRRIKAILGKSSLAEDERKKSVKKAVAQWCGYYAYTDISNKKLVSMTSYINKCIAKHNITAFRVNLVEGVNVSKKRQSNRFRNLLFPVTFDEEYEWLFYYQ